MNHNDSTSALNQFSDALRMAVETRFMTVEHAKSVWTKFLREVGFDTPREDKKTEVKQKEHVF